MYTQIWLTLSELTISVFRQDSSLGARNVLAKCTLYLYRSIYMLVLPHSFYSCRKKLKGSDRELCVYHVPDRTLEHNQLDTNLFNMQLFGPLLLIQQSREQSFMPRERFISSGWCLSPRQITTSTLARSARRRR